MLYECLIGRIFFCVKSGRRRRRQQVKAYQNPIQRLSDFKFRRARPRRGPGLPRTEATRLLVVTKWLTSTQFKC